MPSQPRAFSPGLLQRLREAPPTLLVDPVGSVTIVGEAAEASRQEMFGDQAAGGRMILQDVSKGQLRSTVAEVHGRLVGLQHEAGELVIGAEPREDAVSIPPPWNDLLADQIL